MTAYCAHKSGKAQQVPQVACIGKPCKVQLKRKMNGATAVREILLAALVDIRSNRLGTIADIDPEFLHQFRIAVRRTRSVLSLVEGIFPDTTTTRFYEEFSWLHKATGELRDLDVMLLEREHFVGMVSPDLRPDLEPFFRHLESRRGEALRVVRHGLRLRRLHMLLQSWEAYLLDGEPDAGRRARMRVRPLARKVIGKRIRSARRSGRAIGPSSPDENLHRVRLRVKKLRYIIQFFASLFPPAEIRSYLKRLTDLQDCLGKFNDRCIQIDALGTYLRESASPEETTAIAALITALHTHKLDEKAMLAKKIRHFAKVGDKFQKLCR